MSHPAVCAYCGQALPADAPQGFCPRCLITLGALEMEGASPADDSPPDAESQHPDAARQSRGTGFGHYELLEKIGQGGMGVVYKARQLNLNRLVAVKLLPCGLFGNEGAVRRLRAEAAAAAGLQHPNIVAIHDVGEHEGQHFFSMDLVEGRTLAQLVHQCALPARRAAGYLKAIADAVQYAHQHGILHRDLKPSNIIIDTVDQPRITDFGLAKRYAEAAHGAAPTAHLTLTGQILGSPNFMSPEQASGSSTVGPATDVYSLGALLYHLLTRQPPFQADTLTAVLKQVMEAEPLPPRRLNPEIPRDLETICLKCLEKEPRRRYASARALAEDLGRYLEHQPIRARPVTALGLASKWCRRRPALAGMAGALMMTLVLGMAGVLWQSHRAARMARAEVQQRRRAQASEYAADMHLAQLAIAEKNYGFAVSLLEKYRPPAPRPPSYSDPRRWEWRYLWQLCQPDPSVTIHRYPGSINGIAVSARLSRMAVTTYREVALWDLTTQTPLTSISIGATAAVAFSPADDALALGTWNEAGRPVIDLWEVNGSRVRKQRSYEVGNRALAFSPNGKLLAALDVGGNVRILDLGSGRPLHDVEVPPLRYSLAGVLAFSPDGRQLAIAQDYGRVDVLDLSNRALRPLHAAAAMGFTSVAFSSDGGLLAAGSGYQQGSIYVWDLSSGELRHQFTDHTDDVLALAFLADGHHLTSASTDATLRLWSLDESSEIGRLHSGPEGLAAMAVLPGGQTLVTGGWGGSLTFWDGWTNRRAATHANLPVSPGFEATHGLARADFTHGSLHPGVVRRFGLAFTPDSASLITLNAAGEVVRWDARALRPIDELAGFGRNHWGLALSPDGRWLATGDFEGTVTVWDWASRQPLTNFALPFEVTGFLDFSLGGHYLLGRGMRNDWSFHSRAWRTDSWSEVPVAQTQPEAVFTWELSRDERLLACGYASGLVKVFRFPAVELASTFASQPMVASVRFSTDGRLLYSTSMEGFAAMWDLQTGQQITPSLRGHLGMVLGSAFSPDGSRFATGGATPDDAVKLWDLASHREILSLAGGGNWYLRLDFSPDGSTLAATALSGCVDVWHAPSWDEIQAIEASRAAALR